MAKEKKIIKANLLTGLRTHEVSLVDRGAIGEVFTVIKRAPDLDETDEQIKKELGDEAFEEFQTELQKSLQEHLGDGETGEVKKSKIDFVKDVVKKALGLTKAAEEPMIDFVSNFKSRLIRSNLSDQFWSLTDALRDTIYSIVDSKVINQQELIQETLEAFSNAVLSLTGNIVFTTSLTKSLASEGIEKALSAEDVIEKSGKKISTDRMQKLKDALTIMKDIMNEQENEEDDVMKAEDIAKIGETIAKALEPVSKSISDLNTRLDGVEKKETVEKKDDTTHAPEAAVEKKDNDMATIIAQAISKSLEPVATQLSEISKRVETVEKSADTSRKLKDNNKGEEVKKSIKWPTFAGK